MLHHSARQANEDNRDKPREREKRGLERNERPDEMKADESEDKREGKTGN